MKMALAVAHVLRDYGIGHVFCVSGGASLHLIHGIADTDGIEYVCPHTEMACGFAADAYARLNGLGCAIATSGPGFTNLLTPLAASYYDSIPWIALVGQVTIARMGLGLNVRQMGFQQTPTVPVAGQICKYATEIMTPEECLPELKKAIEIALSGRKGPVLVSLPDCIQRSEIDEKELQNVR